MPPLHTIVTIKSFGCSDIGYWDGEAWYYEDGTRLEDRWFDGLEWE